MSSHADAFAAGAGVAPSSIGADAVARLEQVIAEGRAEHPEIAVDATAFCHHLGEKSEAGVLPAELRGADLFLAFAGACGDEAAIESLRTRFGGDVDRAMTRAGSTGLGPDELRQRVWVKLLTGTTDDPPHIGRYSGRGSLQGWIRVVTSRMAVDLLRSTGARREVMAAPTMLAALGDGDRDPQIEMLRLRYRDEVEAAMHAAFEALTIKDRRLLRGHLIDRLGFDDLGALYGVHRTTAARWLEQARVRLLESAHDHLRGRLDAGDDTARSLVGLVRSELDLSVARLLASRDA